MRVLIVAPNHSDLPDQPKEIADLKQVLDAEVATNGEKTLLETIRNARFDGVWISSHANSEYVQLEGDDHLDAGALAQYLAAVGAKWVVINSCESYEFVDKLQRYYPVDVVAASVKALGDRPAWRTAALIARHLARTQNLREALRLASPGGAAPYRFWPSPQGSIDDNDMGIEQALREEIRTVRSEITSWRIEATEKSQDVAIKLVQFEGRLKAIESMFSAIHTEPAIPEQWLNRALVVLWVIALLVGLLLAINGAGFLLGK